jgi:hypothetical protein
MATDSGSNDTSAPVDSQGSDTGAGDTGVVDAGIPLVLLKCQTWKYAQPVLVQNLDGLDGSSATDFAVISPFPAGPTRTRVAAGRYAGTIFSVYDIDTSQSPPAIASVDAPSVGVASSNYIAAIPRLVGGFGVAVSYQDSQGFVDVDLYPFRDSSPVAPLPTPVRLAQMEGVNSDVRAAVLEVSPSTYFVALQTFVTATSTSTLQIGVAAGGTAATLAQLDSSAQQIFNNLVLAHVGSEVYVYVTSNIGVPAYYKVADTGTTLGPRTPLSRPADAGLFLSGQVTDSVPGSAPSTTNVSYVEYDYSDAGYGPFLVQAAPVPNAKLATLTTADISFAHSYSDLGSVPVSGLDPGRLFGDDYVALSPGPFPACGATSWVNFLWLDVHGVVRGEQVGVNGLLPGKGMILPQNAMSIGATPGPRTAQQAAWNVVWSESDRDLGGNIYEALMYNELDCVP